MATTLEAMTHLRQSNSTENIEQAQRALAVARSQQLDPAVSALPQLATLVQCVDLCSTLQKLDPPQAELKMRTLQTMLDTLPEGHSLTEEGSFAISIAHARFSATKPSMGVVRSMPDGSTELVFNWLPRDDIYALGCLLSGIAITHRNTTDGQKAERMLKEGLRSQDGKYSSRRITIFADVMLRNDQQDQRNPALNRTCSIAKRMAASPQMPYTTPAHLRPLRSNRLAGSARPTPSTPRNNGQSPARNCRHPESGNSLPLRRHFPRNWRPRHRPVHIPILFVCSPFRILFPSLPPPPRPRDSRGPKHTAHNTHPHAPF